MSEPFEWVEHDGLRFRCRRDGPGRAAPWIVFSNSLMTDLTVWDAQVAALKDRFNILRYDQRGHGGTDVPDAPCDFAQLGQDVLALMAHFGIGTCTYVGLSMGVTTGFYLLRERPEVIERAIFSDGQVVTAPTGHAAWEERIETARRIGMPELAKATAERWFSDAFRAAGSGQQAESVAASMPVEGFVACARALQDYDFRDVMAGIRVPVLLMAGQNDGQMPDTMQRMAAQIPGAEMKVIPDAGHIPCYEQPEAFNRNMLDFLARTGA